MPFKSPNFIGTYIMFRNDSKHIKIQQVKKLPDMTNVEKQNQTRKHLRNYVQNNKR